MLFIGCKNCKKLQDQLKESEICGEAMHEILEKHHLLEEFQELLEKKLAQPPAPELEVSDETPSVPCSSENSPSKPDKTVEIKSITLLFIMIIVPARIGSNARVNAVFQNNDPHTANELILDSINIYKILYLDITDMTKTEQDLCLRNILLYPYLEKLSMKSIHLEDIHIKFLHNKLYKSCPHIKSFNISSIIILFK